MDVQAVIGEGWYTPTMSNSLLRPLEPKAKAIVWDSRNGRQTLGDFDEFIVPAYISALTAGIFFEFDNACRMVIGPSNLASKL